MILPEIDLPNLTVHVAPRQLVVSSGADEEGFQICRVIDLPTAMSLEGVDAERFHNVLVVTTAVK
jgi:hypothetical protein